MALSYVRHSCALRYKFHKFLPYVFKLIISSYFPTTLLGVSSIMVSLNNQDSNTQLPRYRHPCKDVDEIRANSETRDCSHGIFGDKNWSCEIFGDKRLVSWSIRGQNIGLVVYSRTKDWSRGKFWNKILVSWNIREQMIGLVEYSGTKIGLMEYSGTKIVLVEYSGTIIGLMQYSGTKDWSRGILGDKNWSHGIFGDKNCSRGIFGNKNWSHGIFWDKRLVSWNILGQNRDRHLKLLALYGTTSNLLRNNLT